MSSRAGPGGRLGVDEYKRAYDALRSLAASPTTTSISSEDEEEFLVGAQQYAYVRLLSYRMHGEQGWVMSDIARDGDPEWIALAQAWEGVIERYADGDGDTAIGSDPDSESEGDGSEAASGPEYMLDELAACRASRSFALLESVMQEYDTDAWNTRFPGFAALLLSMSSPKPVVPRPSLPPFAQQDPAVPEVSEDDSTVKGPSDQASATAPQLGHAILSPEPISLSASISIAMLSAHYPAHPRPLSRVPSTLADAPAKTTSPDMIERASDASPASPSKESMYGGDTPPLTPEKPLYVGRGRTGTQSSVETKVGSPEMLARYKTAASVKSTEDDRRILLWKWMHGANDPVETPQFELPVLNTASYAQMS
ncbi:hypothetical protein AURDEDRAFT_120716 [Auricularia subglabra TFB-10046 SS5]|nr:hypothetical protein AURDEDRAFT_120716 [Auricularia subglabra TFB-10046 SS5]